MARRRKILFWVVSAVLVLALSALLGLRLYQKSDHFRQLNERRLGAFLGLPTEIARINPRGIDQRELHRVRVWLPDRRSLIFDCPLAVWDPGREGGVIELHDPLMLVGSEEWEREDYTRVLRGSLAHDFPSLNVRRIVLQNANIVWPRADVRLTADQVSGSIVFDDTGTGQAELSARRFNGVALQEPVRIAALVDPAREYLLPEVTLRVPRLDLRTLGLDRLLQSRITQGAFAGRITLRQSQAGATVELQGSAENVRLEELTARLPGGPLSAVIDLAIDDGLIRDRRLAHIVFSGRVRELLIDPILARLGFPTMGGRLDLTVYGARIAGETVERLRVAGEWTGASVDRLAELVLKRTGGVNGRLRVRVNDLVLERDEVASADLDVIVGPPEGGPGTIDRALLLQLIQQYAGLPIPEQMLPASVEFVEMGVHVTADREQLRVEARQGPAGPAVITVRMFGQQIPLLGDAKLTFAMDPLTRRLRSEVGQLADKVRERLGRRTATSPAISTRASGVESAPAGLQHRGE